jgi:hypothetical protein
VTRVRMPRSQRPSKRARVTEAQAQCGPSTVTNENRFIPLTPEDEKASESSTTEYDRGYSDTSENERTGPPERRGGSGYSPVSDVASDSLTNPVPSNSSWLG